MAEAKEVPVSKTEAERTAAEVCRLAHRAVEDDRPLFVVVFYRHEGEKLDFLAAVRKGLRERGLQNRTLDPGRNPAHGTGKLYPLLAADDEKIIHFVADLARGDDGAFDPAFLDYLNLHRDRINRETLRWVLLLHDSEAEPFLRQAGDLWDFRQRTFWLERLAEPLGEMLWQQLDKRTENLPLDVEERTEIQQHLSMVREQIHTTTVPEERAALLLDLARWLRQRHAARTAIEVALEGLRLVDEGGTELQLELEGETGIALFHQGQLGEALRHLEKALIIAQEVEAPAGEAAARNNIAQIYYAWGQYDKALLHLNQSLEIYQKIGDRVSVATSRINIASIHRARGQNELALQHLRGSLAIQREIGDHAGEAITLNNIAASYLDLHNLEDALQHLQQSLNLRQELGDRAGEAIVLSNIAQIQYMQGQYRAANQHLQRSLAIQREIDDRVGKATTLNNIARVHAALGRHDDVLSYLQKSLDIRREVGDRSGEATTSWNLGREYERREEWDTALQYLRRAVELEAELDHPQLEAHTEHLKNLEERLAARSRV